MNESLSISVAMCTFNGARYLEEQLKTIASQTRLPTELVVCDDHSGDDSVRIVERFATTSHFPVRVHVNSAQLGVVKNFEQAIQSCSGELIALSDQDDAWKPGKLQRLESEFVANPNLGLVFSDAEIIDENGNRTGRRLWEQVGLDRAERARVLSGRGLLDLLRGSTATGSTMAFRGNLKSLILPIPANLPIIHDAWIALIVSCVADVQPIDQPLVLYRQHSQQQVGPQGRTEAIGGMAAVVRGNAGQAAFRENPYQTTLTLARAAHNRLGEAGNENDVSQARAKLDSLIKHFQARSDLPASFVSRLMRVAEELMTLRYFKFSNGLSSATKDLVVARPNREID